MTEAGLSLDEIPPKIVVIDQQLERRGQTKMMSVIGQQLHAERVDSAEEGAVESGLHFRRRFSSRIFAARAAAFRPRRDWRK